MRDKKQGKITKQGINRARLRIFVPQPSSNKRFQTIQFGLKRLAKAI